MTDSEFRDSYHSLALLREKLDQPVPVYLEEQLGLHRRFYREMAQPHSLEDLLAGREEVSGLLFVVLWRGPREAACASRYCSKRPSTFQLAR
jgi:hypothetical protein